MTRRHYVDKRELEQEVSDPLPKDLTGPGKDYLRSPKVPELPKEIWDRLNKNREVITDY